jgi:hypothetical protein
MKLQEFVLVQGFLWMLKFVHQTLLTPKYEKTFNKIVQ